MIIMMMNPFQLSACPVTGLSAPVAMLVLLHHDGLHS
jgi:hypothetical protein